MLKLQTIKLHNQGALYNQFTFKDDPTQRIGYCRANYNSRRINIFEIVFVNPIEQLYNKGSKLIREVVDKASVESFSENVYNKILENMDIIECEPVQIQLRMYSEVIEDFNDNDNIPEKSEEEQFWESQQGFINSKIKPKTLEVQKSKPLSELEKHKILKIQDSISNLINTEDEDIDIYLEVLGMQSSIQQLLRGRN